jgi:hypothetical protein
MKTSVGRGSAAPGSSSNAIRTRYSRPRSKLPCRTTTTGSAIQLSAVDAKQVMTPPAKAGGFSEERLLAPTAASQATAQVSPCGHLSPLAPEGPIRAMTRGTPCRPGGQPARCVLRTPRFRACNPHTSCGKGAAGSGAARGHAARTVYSTPVRGSNAPCAERGRAFRCQLKQAVPCPEF